MSSLRAGMFGHLSTLGRLRPTRTWHQHRGLSPHEEVMRYSRSAKPESSRETPEVQRGCDKGTIGAKISTNSSFKGILKGSLKGSIGFTVRQEAAHSHAQSGSGCHVQGAGCAEIQCPMPISQKREPSPGMHFLTRKRNCITDLSSRL